MGADALLNEGQILTGPLFSEPMRVETVRSNGVDACPSVCEHSGNSAILPWQWITTLRSARKIVVFGPLEDGELLKMLAPFVDAVAEFKDSVVWRR